MGLAGDPGGEPRMMDDSAEARRLTRRDWLRMVAAGTAGLVTGVGQQPVFPGFTTRMFTANPDGTDLCFVAPGIRLLRACGLLIFSLV